VAKRTFDLGMSIVGLILFSPLLVIAGLGILVTLGWPVLYSPQRAGKSNKLFTMRKFRTMRIAGGPTSHHSGDDDPRVTTIGRWIRKFKLDELPQLWNILVGDMSFVGPRALLPEEIEIEGEQVPVPVEDVPGYEERSRVRPGLTGIAQIYAPRDIIRKHKFRYDLVYVRNRSFWLDLRLILASFWVTFRGKWEYRGEKL